MKQEKKCQEDINELYRILVEECREFQEYLDLLETLPQESPFPSISVEKIDCRSH